MAVYLSDTERQAEFKKNINMIKNAGLLQSQASRLRSLYEAQGYTFGTYGSQMDNLLAEAEALITTARTALLAIDYTPQPIMGVGAQYALQSVTWAIFSTKPTITFSGALTDWPASGTLVVRNSSLSDNNNITDTYTRTSDVITLDSVASPEITEGVDTSCVITFTEY